MDYSFLSSLTADRAWVFYLALPFLGLVLAELVSRSTRRWIVLPRVLWVSLLILLIADWTLVDSKELSEPGTLYVFYDRSDSVLKIPERRKRLEIFLQEIDIWSKEKSQPVELYSFGEEITQAPPQLPENHSFKSQISGINSVIQTNEASIVVISDGNWTDRAPLNLPVFSIQIGESDEKDVWIESLQPVYTAFLKNRLTIPLTIGSKGYEGESLLVELSRGAELIERKELVLEESFQKVELSYFPEKMGEEVLSVSVQSLDEELSDLNNRASFSVRTVRDKIRILHINGKPSIDLKAWRNFLTRQPDVDLVSFYILRSLDDDPRARNYELSLIPFPYEDLFTTELEKFDIVILQNFNFSLYFQPFYLKNLARFAREGGALLMLGGDQSLQEYRFSPIENLMPFKFGRGAGAFKSESVKVGRIRKHPMTEGLELALKLPTWTSYHDIEVDPNASTLVQFENSVPFLTVREAGEGRVAVINSDESWRLQFEPLGQVAPHARLARRVLKYLTFDPEMDPQTIKSSEWSVGAYAHLQLSDEKSIENWEVTPQLSSRKPENFSQTNEITYYVEEPGVYEVKVSGLNRSFIYETKEKPWLGEWKNLLGSNARLESLAKNSGGRFYDFDDRKEVFEQPLTGQQIISADTMPWTRVSRPVSWVVLVCIMALLSLDFFLRKRAQWDA